RSFQIHDFWSLFRAFEEEGDDRHLVFINGAPEAFAWAAENNPDGPINLDLRYLRDLFLNTEHRPWRTAYGVGMWDREILKETRRKRPPHIEVGRIKNLPGLFFAKLTRHPPEGIKFDQKNH